MKDLMLFVSSGGDLPSAYVSRKQSKTVINPSRKVVTLANKACQLPHSIKINLFFELLWQINARFVSLVIYMKISGNRRLSLSLRQYKVFNI